MDTDNLKKEGLCFKPGSFNQMYKSELPGKLLEVEREELPESHAVNFRNKEYKTYITTDDLVLYRIYGRGYSRGKGAYPFGRYASTEFAESQIDAKIRLALDPNWFNTRLVEAKIVVPAGIKLNIGIVAPVTLKTGTVLEGGAEQVLLPENWPNEWIVGYRAVTLKPLTEYPTYSNDDFVDFREIPKERRPFYFEEYNR